MGPQKLSAEDTRVNAPKAPREGGRDLEGVSPSPTDRSGERRELPQRGRPTHLRIFGIFEAHRTLLVERTVLL